MADYYTEACFIIPCTNEQASIAINALGEINGEFSELAESTLQKSSEDTMTPEEHIIRECFLSHPEQDLENLKNDLLWDFEVELCDAGLKIYADETINTKHAAIFTKALLTAFDLPYLVGIQAAHTCNQQRVGAYGGHACVVTKDYIRWASLDDFVDCEIEAKKKDERYFVCKITHINGEEEYRDTFLTKLPPYTKVNRHLNDLFMNCRGESERYENGVVYFEDALAAKDPVMKEITPAEFKVMKEHLGIH